MIRITFIVGGGKLSRNKYDDRALQATTSRLKQCGYVEDRAASCILECGGCYKTQHDTGKNIFTVVVFPKVVVSSAGENIGKKEEDDDDDDKKCGPLLPLDSPGYKMAVCKLEPTFHNLLSIYCPTYTEKKECLRCLAGLIQLEQALEKKMTGGHPLDVGEQSFYDQSSELKEKHEFTQQQITRHIEEGRLTLEERDLLVQMNQQRIESLIAEQNSALVAQKLKMALVRREQLRTISDGVKPVSLPPLRHESRILILRKKLFSLREMEDSSRGRLLSLDETRALAEKVDIENEIERLEMTSRGWFEEEDAFQKRLLLCHQKSSLHRSSKVKSTGAASTPVVDRSFSSNAVKKWILPGERPSKEAWIRPTKNRLRGKGGAIFAAMMRDSSSEDEGEELNEGEDVTNESDVLSAKDPNASNDFGKEGKKKRKKKAKNKRVKIEKFIDPEAIGSSKSSLVSSSLVEFWQTLILPLFISLLSLAKTLVVSLFRKNPNKK